MALPALLPPRTELSPSPSPSSLIPSSCSNLTPLSSGSVTRPRELGVRMPGPRGPGSCVQCMVAMEKSGGMASWGWRRHSSGWSRCSRDSGPQGSFRPRVLGAGEGERERERERILRVLEAGRGLRLRLRLAGLRLRRGGLRLRRGALSVLALLVSTWGRDWLARALLSCAAPCVPVWTLGTATRPPPSLRLLNPRGAPGRGRGGGGARAPLPSGPPRPPAAAPAAAAALPGAPLPLPGGAAGAVADGPSVWGREGAAGGENLGGWRPDAGPDPGPAPPTPPAAP
ncbi:hypothetical protein V8C86DRAFT_2654792 [Haematococcus lacustris]